MDKTQDAATAVVSTATDAATAGATSHAGSGSMFGLNRLYEVSFWGPLFGMLCLFGMVWFIDRRTRLDAGSHGASPRGPGSPGPGSRSDDPTNPSTYATSSQTAGSQSASGNTSSTRSLGRDTNASPDTSSPTARPSQGTGSAALASTNQTGSQSDISSGNASVAGAAAVGAAALAASATTRNAGATQSTESKPTTTNGLSTTSHAASPVAAAAATTSATENLGRSASASTQSNGAASSPRAPTGFPTSDSTTHAAKDSRSAPEVTSSTRPTTAASTRTPDTNKPATSATEVNSLASSTSTSSQSGLSGPTQDQSDSSSAPNSQSASTASPIASTATSGTRVDSATGNTVSAAGAAGATMAAAGIATNADPQSTRGTSKATDADDLTRIKGIGTKTSELLNQNNIHTYRDVANQTPQSLENTLRDGGPMFASNNPASWPAQAKLAIDGQWETINTQYGANGVALTESTDGGDKSILASTATSASSSGTDNAWNATAENRDGSNRGGDDLTGISGIGPQASRLLKADGISSFNDLAAADQTRLRGILQKGGKRFGMLDPQTWPEQASLAAAGKWDALKTMQTSLVSQSKNSTSVLAPTIGATTAASTSNATTSNAAASGDPDNLTRVDGIGPKIAELLNNAGLTTFAQLAATPMTSLQTILQNGGSRFGMADPSTWPEQAELAAAGNWDGLDKLQDQLDGGRRT